MILTSPETRHGNPLLLHLNCGFNATRYTARVSYAVPNLNCGLAGIYQMDLAGREARIGEGNQGRSTKTGAFLPFLLSSDFSCFRISGLFPLHSNIFFPTRRPFLYST